MTKRSTKQTKKAAPKLPFSDKAKKDHVTVHLIVGVSHNGNVITHHPSPGDTMGHAFSDLAESFDFGEHFDVHHFTTVLPFAKAPKPKKARTNKISASRTREAPAGSTDPGPGVA